MEPECIVWPAAERQCHIGAVAEGLREPAKAPRAGLIGLVGNKDRDRAFAIGDEVGPVEPALRLPAAPLAERQQPAKPCIGGPIGWIDEDGHAVREIEAAAHDQAASGRLRRLMGANDAGQAVAVNDRERLYAELCGLHEQFIAGAGASQEAEMRSALQLDIAGRAHPNTP